ncbi:MAG: PfaD family polyunsaturated fatty acid/polyketide biosynthesis protein [Gemmataceae bacterium]
MSSGLSVRPLGWWRPSGSTGMVTDPTAARSLIASLNETVFCLQSGEQIALGTGGGALIVNASPGTDYIPLTAVLPSLTPDQMGDPAFRTAHNLRFNYMTGAMANGIASVEIVLAMSRAGMLGSFGAAGLSIDRITQAVDHLITELGGKPFCVNLIHSPNEQTHEWAVAQLLLKKRVQRVEASAYLDLTPAIVQYRVAGLRQGPNGQVIAENRIIAKVSRVEVATRFLSPPPAKIVSELRQKGLITIEQADLSSRIAMCDDLTAEADSGGHTDNRPAITLLPTMLALRDRIQAQYQFPVPVRVGLAGGIATPAGVSAAFALGAAYVVTGSVNQSCVESGSSNLVRKMLAEASQADVTMAPAADMFEMGVKVQVLRRGTMFAMRGQKLYELYRAHSSWESIPAHEQGQIEKNLLKASFQDVWNQTREFFAKRDPSQLAKAEADPRVKMALVFRWYLGLSSRWANAGEPTRQLDYQIWCGPAMGAFNEWTKGSELERPDQRTVNAVARNLLYGAAIHSRIQQARQSGVELPASFIPNGPWTSTELDKWFS